MDGAIANYFSSLLAYVVHGAVLMCLVLATYFLYTKMWRQTANPVTDANSRWPALLANLQSVMTISYTITAIAVGIASAFMLEDFAANALLIMQSQFCLYFKDEAWKAVGDIFWGHTERCFVLPMFHLNSFYLNSLQGGLGLSVGRSPSDIIRQLLMMLTMGKYMRLDIGTSALGPAWRALCWVQVITMLVTIGVGSLITLFDHYVHRNKTTDSWMAGIRKRIAEHDLVKLLLHCHEVVYLTILASCTLFLWKGYQFTEQLRLEVNRNYQQACPGLVELVLLGMEVSHHECGAIYQAALRDAWGGTK